VVESPGTLPFAMSRYARSVTKKIPAKRESFLNALNDYRSPVNTRPDPDNNFSGFKLFS
jgi:hypothetical protein